MREYNGENKPMYISVLGTVFDVSPSENFIPEKGYGMLWGGRDATYALSKMSLEPADSNKQPGAEWDLKDSADTEKTSLVSWRDHFADKYRVVGQHEWYVNYDLSPLDGIENPKKVKERERKAKEAEAKATAAAAKAGNA